MYKHNITNNMDKTYSIRTIKDIADSTDANNLDDLLDDIRAFVAYYHSIRDNSEIDVEFPDEAIRWTDDGNKEITVFFGST